MRKLIVAASIVALPLVGSTACATKKMVRNSVGEVNEKVDAMGRSLEQTQERTRKNEKKIAEVDEKVQAVDTLAKNAHGEATKAANTATAASNRVEAIDKASRRLIYDLMLSEDEGNFQFGRTDLPQEATNRIDELIHQLKKDPKNVFIEIEGHTDNVGNADANKSLGLARAEAVRRYLYEQYQIPLHKMNIISYGADKPIASNQTKEGRAKNRRVLIRILG
jgi:outer membrane protein OmpA-like peptidoglycan-associated protein